MIMDCSQSRNLLQLKDLDLFSAGIYLFRCWMLEDFIVFSFDISRPFWMQKVAKKKKLKSILLQFIDCFRIQKCRDLKANILSTVGIYYSQQIFKWIPHIWFDLLSTW